MDFSTKQINELITGVQLSAEIQSSSPELRRFISVCGYANKGHHGKRLDKIINNEKLATTAFWIQDYEVSIEYIEKDWEIPDNEIVNNYYLSDIIGIENLKEELLKRISDLSILIPHWKCDAPL